VTTVRFGRRFRTGTGQPAPPQRVALRPAAADSAPAPDREELEEFATASDDTQPLMLMPPTPPLPALPPFGQPADSAGPPAAEPAARPTPQPPTATAPRRPVLSARVPLAPPLLPPPKSRRLRRRPVSARPSGVTWRRLGDVLLVLLALAVLVLAAMVLLQR
jgi:hypothetical protein